MPLVTPQAIDPAHPFPFISNLSLNLLVTLNYKEEESTTARVKVPIGTGIPRFLRIGGQDRFVPLEQVISSNLDLLFPRMNIESCELFYVTRNANLARESDVADDLLAMIESEVRERRFAPIVRVKIQRGMDPYRRGWLAAELGLDPAKDVFESESMLAMRHLFEIATLEFPALRDPPSHPADHGSLVDERSIFYAIRNAGSILLQHPYESFSKSVERFVAEASADPKVRAIKMTLYRTSGETKILDYLLDAARNGKQVAVVVELQARFDEAANIRWASRLEEAGIHVTYGVMGLKTHCKVILVVRQDFYGLRLYAHVGTGNYHAGTARLYDDLGLLTCDDVIGRDLVELFNYLTTGYTPRRRYAKILSAPKLLKRSVLSKISREMEVHAEGRHGTHPAQGERTGGRRHRQGALRGLAGRRAGRSLRAGHLPAAARAPGGLGEHPGGQRGRTVPRAQPDLLLPKRWRGGVLHRLRRPDEAQSGAARRDRRSRRGAGAARGTARRPRSPHGRTTAVPGTCSRTEPTCNAGPRIPMRRAASRSSSRSPRIGFVPRCG